MRQGEGTGALVSRAALTELTGVFGALLPSAQAFEGKTHLIEPKLRSLGSVEFMGLYGF
jgi:hypothetical protein